MPSKPERLSQEPVDSLQEAVEQIQAWWVSFIRTAVAAVQRLRQHGDFSRCHDEIGLNQEPLWNAMDVFNKRLHAVLPAVDGATRVQLLSHRDKLQSCTRIPLVFNREYEATFTRRSPQVFADALPTLAEQHCGIRESWSRMEELLHLAIEAEVAGQLGGGADGQKTDARLDTADGGEYQCADWFQLKHGIPQARLSEKAADGKVKTTPAPRNFPPDSQGRKVRQLYHVGDALKHCKPQRVTAKTRRKLGPGNSQLVTLRTKLSRFPAN